MKSYNRDLEIGLCPQHSIPEIHPGVCVLAGVGGGPFPCKALLLSCGCTAIILTKSPVDGHLNVSTSPLDAAFVDMPLVRAGPELQTHCCGRCSLSALQKGYGGH